jgi:hypothetical protein
MRGTRQIKFEKLTSELYLRGKTVSMLRNISMDWAKTSTRSEGVRVTGQRIYFLSLSASLLAPAIC